MLLAIIIAVLAPPPWIEDPVGALADRLDRALDRHLAIGRSLDQLSVGYLWRDPEEGIVRTSFENALAFTLRWEGGLVDHPADPGGKTNLGITQRTLDQYRRGLGLPLSDVANVTPSDASAIYKGLYWKALELERVHPVVALVLLDTAVNFGIGRARAFLRLLLNSPRTLSGKDDGIDRLQKLQFQTELALVCFQIIGMRKAWRYQRVLERPDQNVFLKGWLRRDAALEAEASRRLGVMTI